ncbi:hypothetical protein ACER0A_001400 [Haloimpatiens sp. FM7315]|uniref:hypothetical protein n=1 Tax=Haloimpatiens sp. FM7315 TaxID=3298609 RepID=UPI0035A29993
MKIYNKKKFISGIVFLALAFVNIGFMIVKFDSLTTLIIVKHSAVNIFCVLFGITEVYRSLNRKCTIEDIKNEDERELLINMKSKSRAFTITLGICVTIILLSMAAWALTKNDIWMGVFVCMSSFFTIMIITVIGSYVYFNRRN